MTGERIFGLIWFALAFTLLVSGIVARRLPISRTIAMGLAWVGIFGLGFVTLRFLGFT